MESGEEATTDNIRLLHTLEYIVTFRKEVC